MNGVSKSCEWARQTPSCRSSLGQCTLAASENGGATKATLVQLTAALDDVMSPGKEGQSWILLWDMASIHATEAT